jgi:tRNA A-37 threonylcarbamoyl transferase component Bud32
MRSIPTGYTRLQPEPGLTLVLRESLVPALTRHGLTTFPEPGSVGEVRVPAGGRAPVTRITIDDGPPLVLKNYRRGGLLGRVRGDRYSGNSRAWNELEVCHAAATAGLRVQPIEVFWVRKLGSLSHRYAAATREIPNAEDVFQTLARLAGDRKPRLRLLSRVATEVRGLHDTGIHHPDLNLGNILVSRDDPDTVHLIDFDKATRQDGPLPPAVRHHALARLYRSLVKLSLPNGPEISSEEKSAFISTYFGADTGDTAALRRFCRRSLALHRLWWRISPPKPRKRES